MPDAETRHDDAPATDRRLAATATWAAAAVARAVADARESRPARD
ncbi:hypothetical protein [Herbiconiux sp. A18JL235]|uniref:Uncharacterized protein n=1 Tax=Herbiconiux sp. A18JL235 TaxID=3152363 RepID=A0AB39BDT9_9MICO